jgi:uncharacterized protein
MKFLTFSDLHGDKVSIKEIVLRAKKDDIDFLLCAGDFSEFSRGLRPILEEFNSIGKKVYLIPGNHEEGGDKLTNALIDLKNCINIDKRAAKIGKYIFLGYGGGGFEMEDPEFRKIARHWYGKYNGEKIVLVTHQNPFDTKLDLLGERHVGNIDYRKFIERIKPKVAISGHLHETAGVMDKVGKTKIVNPGWEGMVIELK